MKGFNKNSREILPFLLFDLEAISPGVRLNSILQLRPFLNSPDVKNAVVKRLEVEDNPECRFQLLQLQRIQLARSDSRPVSRSSTAPEFSEEKLVQGMLEKNASAIEDFLIRARTLPVDTTAGIVRTIFQKCKSPEVFQAVLTLEDDFFKSQNFSGQLCDLIRHDDPMVVIRSLQILHAIAPGTIIVQLPVLLLHPVAPVRLMAIRILYKLCPDEAIRLLEELVHSDDNEQAHAVFSLFFVFPFEDTSTVLIQLLEKEKISPEAARFLDNFVKSNPNRGFLKRLLGLYFRGRGTEEILAQFARSAAEALSLSREEPGDSQEILERYVQEEQKRLDEILTRAGSTLKFSAKLPAAEKPSPEVASEETDKQEIVVPVLETGQTAPPQEVPTALQKDALIESLDKLREPHEVLAALKDIEKLKLRDDFSLEWVENHLHSSSETCVPAMNVLAEVARKRLLPHLPVLAFNKNPEIATQAIRLLRRIEGPAFFRRLSQWMNDRTSSGKSAAMIGLVQVDFMRASTLILDFLEKTRELDLIQSFGNILLMNPERKVLRSLEKLALTSPADKRACFNKLSEELKKNLDLISSTSERESSENYLREFLDSEQLQETWNKALEQIRRIKYAYLNPALAEGISPAKTIAGITIFLVSLVVLSKWLFSGADPMTGNVTPGQEIQPTRISLPQQKFELSIDNIIRGVLGEYDPINHTWKMKTNDEFMVKLDFADKHFFKAGDKLEVVAKDMKTSPLGFPIIRVLRARARD